MTGPAASLRTIVCAALLVVPAPGAEVVDRVLAVVAGDLILLSDVAAVRELELRAPPSSGDPTAEILAGLIDRTLILGEVERYAPPEPEAADVDAALQQVRARFGTDQAFAGALARVGLDPQQLRERLRQDLRIEAYLEQRFSAGPAGDDAAAALARRATLVEEWLADLRRRTEVTNFYTEQAPER